METRRSVLRGALSLPVLAVPAGVATVTLAHLWEKHGELLAAWRKAEAEAEAAEKRCDAAMPSRPREMRPNGYFLPFANWFSEQCEDGKSRPYGTSRQWQDLATKRWAKGDREVAQEAEKRAAAARAFEQECARLEHSTGYVEACRAAVRASDALTAIEDQILAAPAAGCQDLAIKARVVRRIEGEDHEKYECSATIALLADIERFALGLA